MAKKKYNLEHRFSLLPRHIEWEHVYLHAGLYGISKRTFQNDRKIEIGSAYDIPTERLLKYAKIFKCDIQDLINYDVNVKPLKV